MHMDLSCAYFHFSEKQISSFTMGQMVNKFSQTEHNIIPKQDPELPQNPNQLSSFLLDLQMIIQSWC